MHQQSCRISPDRQHPMRLTAQKNLSQNRQVIGKLAYLPFVRRPRIPDLVLVLQQRISLRYFCPYRSSCSRQKCFGASHIFIDLWRVNDITNRAEQHGQATYNAAMTPYRQARIAQLDIAPARINLAKQRYIVQIVFAQHTQQLPSQILQESKK